MEITLALSYLFGSWFIGYMGGTIIRVITTLYGSWFS